MSAIASEKWFLRPDRTLGSQPEALEVAVEVSGAQVAGSGGTRELFSEDTHTTLVFADGAVVRLSAAIAVGQMLFLKHKESQREMVTRVLRQRSFGTKSTYVELEFAEPAPGFWGEVLSPAPSTLAEKSVTEQTETAVARDAADHAADHDAGEGLYVLLNPIASREPATPASDLTATMGQLSDLLQSAAPKPELVPATMTSNRASIPPEELGPPDELGDLRALFPALEPAAPTASTLPEKHDDGGREETSSSGAMDAEPSSPVAKNLEDISGEITAEDAQEEDLKLPSTGKSPVRLTLLAAVLILVLLAGVAYQQGLLGDWFANRGVRASSAGTIGSLPIRPPRVPKGGPKSAQATAADQASSGTANAAAPAATTTTEVQPSGEESTSQNPGRPTMSADPERQSAAVVLTSSEEPVQDAVSDDYEPPKLVKAVNAVPPPEAVQNFVTGDVKFDASVDAKGKVSSAKVVSGPAALHAAALEALKHYQYKPALKNGQPVSGHVTVSVKFWYEP
ncbi:MAG TPA: TonB family protein [Candidatus Acidoferrum sp.]|nr:TonB family protein [Candidatus Acidoferrum sp.]